VLPEASLPDAERRAEELRGEIKRLRVSDKGRLLGPVTISIGLAAYPEHGLAGDALLHAADSALYRAKREGRDRVVIAETEVPRPSGARHPIAEGGEQGAGSRDPFP